MINIVIPFDEKSPSGPPFNSENYKNGYIELSEKAKKQKMNIYFSRGLDAYVGKGVFNNCYEFVDKEIKYAGKIKADAVFDKSVYLKPDGSYPCINNKVIKNICMDKNLTAEMFPEFSPRTALFEEEKELVNELKKSNGIVVIKPVDGSAGKGVIIENADKVNTVDVEAYPVIFQQFIDTSKGIPGIVEGRHDFRVCIVDGRIIYSFVRTPGKGDYRAGLATGGTLSVVDINKVPSEVEDIATAIEKEFSKYGHRLYTVDVAFDGSKFWLIELNSQPGLSSESFFPNYATIYQKELLDLLEKVANID